MVQDNFNTIVHTSIRRIAESANRRYEIWFYWTRYLYPWAPQKRCKGVHLHPLGFKKKKNNI